VRGKLGALHGAQGDDALVHWIAHMPYPLPNREYLLRRRLGELQGAPPRHYLKMEQVVEPPAGLRLERQKRATWVTEYAQSQLLWPGEAEGTTSVRTSYLEDPMMSLPGWLVTYLIDKTLPKGVKSMIKAAVEYEERHPPGPQT